MSESRPQPQGGLWYARANPNIDALKFLDDIPEAEVKRMGAVIEACPKVKRKIAKQIRPYQTPRPKLPEVPADHSCEACDLPTPTEEPTR